MNYNLESCINKILSKLNKVYYKLYGSEPGG
jgi:hypothetical protein